MYILTQDFFYSEAPSSMKAVCSALEVALPIWLRHQLLYFTLKLYGLTFTLPYCDAVNPAVPAVVPALLIPAPHLPRAQLCTVALGQYLMAGLIPLVNSYATPWIPSDLNDGKLDEFFLLCGFLIAANLAIFVCVSKSFTTFSSAGGGPAIEISDRSPGKWKIPQTYQEIPLQPMQD